jgi:hypothetical protein
VYFGIVEANIENATGHSASVFAKIRSSELDFIHFLTRPMPQNQAIPCAFAAFLAVEVGVRHDENPPAIP